MLAVALLSFAPRLLQAQTFEPAAPRLFAFSQDGAGLPTNLDPVAATQPAATSRPVDAHGAKHPEESSAERGDFPTPAGSTGLEEFVNHFAPHEPIYFIAGWESPAVRFQLSGRYRIFSPGGELATKYPFVKGFNLAYTQTSLWDVSKPSAPFFDSSYRPEFFYYLENVRLAGMAPNAQLGGILGVGHESNGKDGADSRSLNIAYIRPILSTPLGSHDWFVTFAPKLYIYIGDLSDNPDIKRYRGFADLRLVVGQRDGLQLAAIGRIGDHFDRASGQFDLTYPLTKLFRGNVDLCLDAQYFIGYGESLLTYKQYDSVFRIGVNVVR